MFSIFLPLIISSCKCKSLNFCRKTNDGRPTETLFRYEKLASHPSIIPPAPLSCEKNPFRIEGSTRVQRGSKNRHANKEIYAGRRTRIALGSWNELGAAGTHHFLFVAPPHVLHSSTSPSSLDLSFCTYRDGWLHNLEDVRATTMQKRGAARRGAASAVHPCQRCARVP